MKTIFIFAIAIFGCVSKISAQVVEKLVVQKNDQTEVSFLLSDKPVIKYLDDFWYKMKVITSFTEMEFNTEELDNMRIQKVDLTDINEVSSDNDVTLSKGSILVVNTKSGVSDISIHGIDGKSFLSKKLLSGIFTFNLNELPKGMYIVSTNGKTVKITNR